MTESPTEHRNAPAPEELPGPAEAPDQPPRSAAWRRAASSVFESAATGAAAGVPF